MHLRGNLALLYLTLGTIAFGAVIWGGMTVVGNGLDSRNPFHDRAQSYQEALLIFERVDDERRLLQIIERDRKREKGT